MSWGAVLVCCGVMLSASIRVASSTHSTLAWGLNEQGILGSNGGVETAITLPTIVEALEGKAVQDLALGEVHGVAIDDDETIYTWGAGQEVQGEAVAKWGVGKPVQVAAGAYHSLALFDSGSIMAWGANDMGQLGIGKSGSETVRSPTLIEGLGSVGVAEDIVHIVKIACGDFHSLALTSDGNVLSWGSNTGGLLGHGSDGLGAELKLSSPALIESLLERSVVDIAAGVSHSVVLLNSGDVMAWGVNTYGQLGLGDSQSNQPRPTLVVGLEEEIVGFASGGYHVVAVAANGGLYAWGRNSQGQLGLGHTNDVVSAQKISWFDDLAEQYENHTIPHSFAVANVACGDGHTVALLKSGQVYGWGSNDYGEVGVAASSDPITHPTAVTLPEEHWMTAVFAKGSSSMGTADTRCKDFSNSFDEMEAMEALLEACQVAYTNMEARVDQCPFTVTSNFLQQNHNAWKTICTVIGISDQQAETSAEANEGECAYSGLTLQEEEYNYVIKECLVQDSFQTADYLRVCSQNCYQLFSVFTNKSASCDHGFDKTLLTSSFYEWLTGCSEYGYDMSSIRDDSFCQYPTATLQQSAFHSVLDTCGIPQIHANATFKSEMDLATVCSLQCKSAFADFVATLALCNCKYCDKGVDLRGAVATFESFQVACQLSDTGLAHHSSHTGGARNSGETLQNPTLGLLVACAFAVLLL